MDRCRWCQGSELAMRYHDEEWGRPLHNDRMQFEYLSMEVMQCGLSWTLMLKKREIFRKCFQEFDFNRIAGFSGEDIEEILQEEGMIRSRRKIEAIVGNARAFIRIIEEYGSFDRYIWNFTEGKSYIYLKHHNGESEASNELSDRISSDLKKRGFKYLGSITVYSYLQSCGIINDHEEGCFLYKKLVSAGNIKYIRD